MAASKTARVLAFKTGEMIVYPAHGVGRVTAIEEQEVAGFKLELFVVYLEKDRLTLRNPTAKASTGGMRKLADPAEVVKALDLLSGRARVSRAMWSRRAAEYQGKINSGDLIAVTEVVRDLSRSPDQPEALFSERGLHDSALDLLMREIAAVNNITETEALKLIQQSSVKAPRTANGSKPEADAEANPTNSDEEAA